MAFISGEGGIGSGSDTLVFKVAGEPTALPSSNLAHYLRTSAEGAPLYMGIVVNDLSKPGVFLRRAGGNTYYFGQLVGNIVRQADDLIARVRPFSDEVGENLRAELREITQNGYSFFPYLPMNSIQV